MNRKIMISSAILMLLVACAKNDRITLTDKTTIHPILNMEIIGIPSIGKVIWIDGGADIKKNGLNEYAMVILGTKINEGDILWLKKETIVKIQFEDSSYVVNEPVSGESFFMFELIDSP